MKLFDKIKKLFTRKKTKAKVKSKKKKNKNYFFWLLPFLAALLLFLMVKGCSSHQKIRKTSYLVGREANYQVELLGRDRNFTGFTNDLLATIGRDNHIQFEWKETHSNRPLEGLDASDYDFVLTSIRPNIINQEHYDFSEPIFDLGPVLIVNQDSQITSLSEMQNLPIGISYGFPTNFNALRLPGLNNYEMEFVSYGNINRALDDLTSNHIDGVIMNAIPAYALTEGLYAGRLKVVSHPFNDEGFRIVSLKNPTFEEIITMINQSINKMRQDGTYHTLIKKWDLIDAQSEYWHPDEVQK
jgi:ABC-type amino acid transport substrate-binding protein